MEIKNMRHQADITGSITLAIMQASTIDRLTELKAIVSNSYSHGYGRIEGTAKRDLLEAIDHKLLTI